MSQHKDRRRYVRPNLNEHPLLSQAYRLGLEVETLPAHIDQTSLSAAYEEWIKKLYAHLEKHVFPNKRGKEVKDENAFETARP